MQFIDKAYSTKELKSFFTFNKDSFKTEYLITSGVTKWTYSFFAGISIILFSFICAMPSTISLTGQAQLLTKALSKSSLYWEEGDNGLLASTKNKKSLYETKFSSWSNAFLFLQGWPN